MSIFNLGDKDITNETFADYVAQIPADCREITFSGNFDLREIDPLVARAGELTQLISINFCSTSLDDNNLKKLTKAFPNLKFLYLTDVDITTLEPLKDLHLVELSICGIKVIKDLSPLQSSVSTLKVLDISATSIMDLTLVGSMENLEDLGLVDMPRSFNISCLKPLETLLNIKKINAADNEDLEPEVKAICENAQKARDAKSATFGAGHFDCKKQPVDTVGNIVNGNGVHFTKVQ